MNLPVRDSVAEALQFPQPDASPFPIVVDLHQVVPYPGWCAARERVLAALRTGRNLVLVTGVSGIGKTLLLQDLARSLETEGVEVLLQRRGDAPVPTVPAGAVRRRIALVDEADRINQLTLQGLRSLGATAVVLAFSNPPPRGDDTVVHLAPLSRSDTRAFIEMSLARSGLPKDFVSEAAIERLLQHSDGIPSQLNILAGASLMFAQGDDARRVGAEHVDGAAALRAAMSASESILPADKRLHWGAPLPLRRTRRLRPALMVGVAVVAVCLGAILTADLVGKRHPQTSAASSSVSATNPPTPSTNSGTPPAISTVPSAAVPSTALASVEQPSPAPAPQASSPGVVEFPTGAPVLVAVRFDRSAGGASLAERFANALRDAGYVVNGPAATTRHGMKAGAHYMFAEDEKAAEVVLRTVGLSVQDAVADTVEPGVPVRPGVVELVVPLIDTTLQSRLETEGSGHP